ncbi:5,6-dimethylbenzimidazole synthase [Nocardioides aurantiacus]|uniref:Nicotinate-nucleotide--dimethylbenzimidazole phosphoribosyltransferase n=1 Tax=Nocardioides aurantiacus TaxID=86796 RepID=A0A3N2CRZ9_9ACTN|nr:5,6-dimethylbenzimidazole synthase [Nocardioides aurantiacus]ROR90290.1 cob(II)yrinic acid a,c-diamide reductase [Nocardioides aurantiacus]
MSPSTWNRPVPLIGDRTSAAERAEDVAAWAFPEPARQALHDVVAARRDIRRYRPDPVEPEVLQRVLAAAHAAPSVGHSQPWRFVVVSEPATRERAARMADEQRLRQAAQLEPDAARRLLDLQLEGIREAPLGVVVACDRRTPAAGVLGRATFPDADLWSCACAIQNLWLAARAEGLGVGWVTLFDPADLEGLLGLPDGVVTLGWLCLGWPDERPPAPGLERAGWSRRQPVADVVMAERWTEADAAPAPPPSHLRAPGRAEVVEVRDHADAMLTPPGSLGLLDRAVDRLEAAARLRPDPHPTGGALLVVAGRHPVTRHGVSAYADAVTDDVVAAARAGESAGAAAARAAHLAFRSHDAGTATGDLVHDDALTAPATAALVTDGRELGRDLARDHLLVAVGEVGVGNTTVAAALAALLLDLAPDDVVGLGSGADSAMLERKRGVVARALARARTAGSIGALEALGAVGGPEVAVLAGVVLGAAEGGAVTVLDGLATSVAAVVATRLEPGVAAYLVAGQRSRERAHARVLEHLGLEPLLDLRLRAGEGVGAALASGTLLSGLELRRGTGRTTAPSGPAHS